MGRINSYSKAGPNDVLDDDYVAIDGNTSGTRAMKVQDLEGASEKSMDIAPGGGDQDLNDPKFLTPGVKYIRASSSSSGHINAPYGFRNGWMRTTTAGSTGANVLQTLYQSYTSDSHIALIYQRYAYTNNGDTSFTKWTPVNNDSVASNILELCAVNTFIDRNKVKPINSQTSVLILGDSIACGSYSDIDPNDSTKDKEVSGATDPSYGWAKHLETITGCDLDNLSYPGAMLSSYNNSAYDTPKYASMLRSQYLTPTGQARYDASDYDLIIVAIGTNDAGFNTPMYDIKYELNRFLTWVEETGTDSTAVVFITPIRRVDRAKSLPADSLVTKTIDDATTQNRRIAEISAVICNAALHAGHSVINGYDIPLVMGTVLAGNDEVLIPDSSYRNSGTIYSQGYPWDYRGTQYDDPEHLIQIGYTNDPTKAMSSDTVHPSKDGHLIYAKYILYIINSVGTVEFNGMDYAPLVNSAPQIKSLPKGQVFMTSSEDEPAGVKTEPSGTVGSSLFVSKGYVDRQVTAKQDAFDLTSPRCIFASLDDITYAVGDIFYHNNKLYKYTGYTSGSEGGQTYYEALFDILGTKSTTSIRDPETTETVSEGRVSSYNVGDTYIKIRATSDHVYDAYICAKVTRSIDSNLNITYTYLWENQELCFRKVTSLSASSTDAQYPSAKCVYDALSNIPAVDSYTKNQTNELLAEKAPVIEVETDTAYDSDLSELKSQSVDNNLIVEAQQGTLGHPHLYLSQGANLLPPINSASSIGTVSGVTIEIVDGNTIKLNGTATAKINIWLKANNNNPMTMLQQVNQGDTVTVGAMYRGAASGSSIQIVQRLDQADDTENIRNSKYIDFSEDKYSAELQTTADCPKCRICIIVPSGGSYTDFIITPFMFAGNSINVVENPVYTAGQLDISNTVSTYNYLSTYPNQHKVSYKIDTKTYVDNKEVDPEEVSELVDEGIADAMPTINNTISTNVNTAVNGKITYITPEQYGAKGNGNDDDTVALQACLDAANSSNYVLGLKRYKITSPIRICGTQNSGNNIHVELNRVDYTGNDFAVKIASRWGNIKIHRLESSGNGILIKDDNSGTAVKANNFAFDFIYSSGDCIKFESTKRDNIAYNTFNVPFLHSTNGNLININYATVENLFIGNRPECPNGWAIYHSNAYNTFMRFAFEYTLDICLGHGKFIDCRTTEGLNYYDWKGRESKFIKLTRTTTYGGREIADANTPVTFTGVDVSELSTFSEIMATLDDKIAEQDPDNPQKYFIGCQEIITYAPNIISNIARYDATNYEEILDGIMVIYWNKKAYVPNSDVLEDITTTPFVPLDTVKNNPTYFRIGVANCVINLNDSYCPVGIDSFIVEQTNSYKASIYNKDNILIFDGANEPAGKYKVSCYVTPLPSNIFDSLVNLPSYKKIHYAEKIKYLYTGTNEAWVVTPL